MARRWDRWPRYAPSSPLRAEDGIKARSKRGSIGEKWWSRRFVHVLESFGMGARLGRGRRYARSGQVMDLAVGPGLVSASVQGSRSKPYKVKLAIEPFAAESWDEAIEVMARQAVFAARLLTGEMPDEIEEAFTEAGLSLFPAGTSDLSTVCSCPDWANPCKHLAATLYILAEQFDDDPWAILAWRGRTREQVLARMRELRGSTVAGGGSAAAPAPARLPDPAGDDEVADWFAGEVGQMEEARRAVTEASAARSGAGAAVLDMLGPMGLVVGGRDAGDWLRRVYDGVERADAAEVPED